MKPSNPSEITMRAVHVMFLFGLELDSIMVQYQYKIIYYYIRAFDMFHKSVLLFDVNVNYGSLSRRCVSVFVKPSAVSTSAFLKSICPRTLGTTVYSSETACFNIPVHVTLYFQECKNTTKY